jgi:hypothetical protein
MQEYFPDRKTLCQIQGKSNEYIVFSRISRGSTTKSLNSKFKGLLQDDTNIENGDLITENGNKYFITAVRKSYLSTIAELYKANCDINIFKLEDIYNVNHQKTGTTETMTFSNIPTLQETITTTMKQYDLGLLPKTVKKFIVPKNSNIKLLDRIKIGYWYSELFLYDFIAEECYQVDSIDNTTYKGLLYIQCSIDIRSVTV